MPRPKGARLKAPSSTAPATSTFAASVAVDDRFTLENLKAPEGLEDAASWLVRRMGKASPSGLRQLFEELSDIPDRFALILSGDAKLCNLVIQLLTATTTTTPDEYLASSQAVIIEKLSQFLKGLTLPRDLMVDGCVELIDKLWQNHHLLKEGSPSKPPPTIHRQNDEASAAHRRKSRRATLTSVRDAGMTDKSPEFPDLEPSVSAEVLSSQTLCLKILLGSMFTQPAMVKHLREVVLKVVDAPPEYVLPPHSVQRPPPEIIAPLHDDDTRSGTDPDSLVTLFSRISPAKARALFDSPEGWGAWHLFLSSRAIRDMRTFHSSDISGYRIIQKKLEELSEGFFSEDNHKHLVGGSTEIHLYEAKLTRDLRLVYRIELQSDEDLRLDRQVLFVYGIYTHAKLDKRFWAQVAYHHPRSESQYQERTKERSLPIKYGSSVQNVIPPLEWPHRDYSIKVKPTPLGYSEEDFLELHRISSLEKFIPFSQSVLQAILAEADMTHRFVVNPTETKVINHPSSCFVIGRSGTGKTTTMVFKILQMELTAAPTFVPNADEHVKLRQLFVTQSHHLATRVEIYYKQLKDAAEFSGVAKAKPAPGEERILDAAADHEHRPDLPERFSELTDAHFPLFLTFDQLRRLLENEFDISFGRSTTQSSSTSAGTVVQSEGTFEFDGFVSYRTFLAEYWPHIDQRLTKALDPALVFSEIIGVILGVEMTTTSTGVCLSRESYLALSDRAYSSLAEHRSRIYDIFEKYSKLKYERHCFDTSDRTREILAAMRSKDVNRGIDFLYVDEVQDLRIADLKVLSQLSTNPHGRFWGGDTAQTINIGSSFRLEELKDLMYRAEKADPLVLRRLRRPVHPATFQLLVNYRSHGGIVDCAASLIELMASRFPGSVDALQRETALISGPRPVVFRGDKLPIKQFTTTGGGAQFVELGAHQAILVRDEASRQELLHKIGNPGILTLLESKGLEFDDVLLYNFLTTSPASTTQWRVVSSGDTMSDLSRYRTVEAELKRLYVAVTRARHHCWIWESSSGRLPMLDLWETQGLVRLHDSSSPIPRLAVHSTPEEWHKRGYDMFEQNLFDLALSAFAKAGSRLEELVCRAYVSREKARTRDDFFATATSFTDLGTAAFTMPDKLRVSLFRRAAECYRKADDANRAAECLVQAGDFTLAAVLYRKAGNFRAAVELVKPASGATSKVEPRVMDEILDVAKLEYLRRNNLKRAAFVFDYDVDKQIEYIDLYGLQATKLSILKQAGRFEEAGDVHQQAGEILEAATCFLRSPQKEVRRRVVRLILQEVETVAFAQYIPEDSRRLLDVLGKPALVEDMTDDERNQLSMFRAIVTRNRPHLLTFAQVHARDNFRRALCQGLSILYTDIPFEEWSLATLIDELTLRSDYFSTLRTLARHSSNLCLATKAARLLGIRPACEIGVGHPIGHFMVKKSSYLGRAYTRTHREDQSGSDFVVLSATDMDFFARTVLSQDIHSSIMDLQHRLRSLPVLKPCHEYAVKKSCKRLDCRRNHSMFNEPGYSSTLVRVDMMVIVMLDDLTTPPIGLTPMQQSEARHGFKSARRIWLHRFFDHVHPITHHLGSATAHRGLTASGGRILREWVHDILFNMEDRFCDREEYLSEALRLVWLGYIANDWTVAPIVQNGGPLALSYPRHDLMRMRVTGDPDAQVVMECVAVLDTQRGGPKLRRAFLAIEHICSHESPVDIRVFMVLLEHIALEVIITLRGNAGLTPDGVVLPRSWALRAHRPTERVLTYSPPMQLFFDVAGSLMRKLHVASEDGSFLHPIKAPTIYPLPRAMLIARLCRLLVLVGYNCFRSLREPILHSITSALNSEIPHPHFLYAKYAQAKSWSNLVNALFSSSRATDHDYLVATFHRGRLRPIPSLPRNVRLIRFLSPRDIFEALDFRPIHPSSEKFAPSVVGQEVNPAVLHRLAAEVMHDKAVISTALSDDVQVSADEILNVEELDVSGADVEYVAEDVEDIGDEDVLYVAPEREQGAAVLIQRWYRAWRRRHSSPREPTLAQSLSACLADLPNVEAPLSLRHLQRKYRALLRGPLVHATCALERLLPAAVRKKNEEAKKAAKVEHQELEAVQTTMRALSSTIKCLTQFQRELGPTSTLFRSGNALELRKAAVAMMHFIRSILPSLGLDSETRQAIDRDLNLVDVGLIKEPKAPAPSGKKRRKRPSLNATDILE